MSDPNEIRALKASYLGVLDTTASITALQQKIESLDDRGDVPPADLEEFARVTTAHAVAAAALRGLVNSMVTRREASTA